MLEQISGVSSPQQKQGKLSYQHVFANSYFSRYSPTSCWPQYCRFLFVGTFKNLSAFSFNWK